MSRRHLFYELHNSGEVTQGFGLAAPAGDNEIGTAALYGIRHLPRQDPVEFFLCHAGARQHPGLLEEARRLHHDRRIAPNIELCLEQQRDVEYHQRHAPDSTTF